MKQLMYGDTYKRYAYVGKQANNQYFVSFTDWTTRKGGSKANMSLNKAKFMAKKFVEGCKFIFDSNNGIVLQIEYKR